MAKITNYGNSRNLPYRSTFVFIPKGGYIETNDLEMAKEMRKYPFIDVKLELERKSGDELRRIAEKLDIKISPKAGDTYIRKKITQWVTT